MSRIPSRDTRPEIAVRSLLHRLGFCFRLHVATLPGRPDIVLPRLRTVVFVHGCFWHQHEGCIDCSKPATRTAYWAPKLARNVARDAAHRAALHALGWKVIIVWECETLRPELLRQRLAPLLGTGEKAEVGRRIGSPRRRRGTYFEPKNWSEVRLNVDEFEKKAASGYLRATTGNLPPFIVGSLRTPLSLGLCEGYPLEDIAYFYDWRRTERDGTRHVDSAHADYVRDYVFERSLAPLVRDRIIADRSPNAPFPWKFVD